MQIKLNKQEIEIIKNTLTKIFGECEIYIFGSRLKRTGGDVDIFIVPINRNNLFDKMIKAKVLLKDTLLRNVDIVIHKDFNLEIEKEALKGVKI
ncbi:nucleotidyltransferase domain-containing protein [Caminibacter sp.]